MAAQVKPKRESMLARLRDVVSAHHLVSQGIATHAEKEQARKQALYHQLEATRRLTAGTGGTNASP